jgi:hypothetical protein
MVRHAATILDTRDIDFAEYVKLAQILTRNEQTFQIPFCAHSTLESSSDCGIAVAM